MENKVSEPRFRSLVKNLNDIFDNVAQNIITETNKSTTYNIYFDNNVDEFQTTIYTDLIKIPEEYFDGPFEIRVDGLEILFRGHIKEDLYQTNAFIFNRRNGYMFVEFDSKIKLGTEVKVVNQNTKKEWVWVFGGEANYW